MANDVRAAGLIASAGVASASAASLGANPVVVAVATVIVASLAHVVPQIVQATSDWYVARLRANAKRNGVAMPERDEKKDDERKAG